jgi:hypothetical protein
VAARILKPTVVRFLEFDSLFFKTAGDSTEYDGRPFSLSLPRMVMFSYDVIVMESMISHI